MNDLLRMLPAMDKVLEHPDLNRLKRGFNREHIVRWATGIQNEIRMEIREGKTAAGTTREQLLGEIVRRLLRKEEDWRALRLRRVINATGVIIHTNLGRSPIWRKALERLPDGLAGYTDLEYDLDTGRRGHRDTKLSRVLSELLSCEDATAVNNNAGAVMLILNELARGGEVIVSRSELVEIGGSFRVPDIMTQSGAILREVGTTNKTHLRDYEQAISAQTRMILQVHQSNFEIQGFTSSPDLADLADLAAKHKIPFVVDAGSGYLFDDMCLPVDNEPVIFNILKLGADLVCFSGDKLLGGPQGGLIVGRGDLVRRLRSNPLMRVLRLDKLILHVLLDVLWEMFSPDRMNSIPIYGMMTQTVATVKKRNQLFRRRLRRKKTEAAAHVSIGDGYSLIGGGSTPGQKIPTSLISLAPARGTSNRLETCLRLGDPPVITRVDEAGVLLDLRTVNPEEEAEILDRLVDAFEAGAW